MSDVGEIPKEWVRVVPTPPHDGPGRDQPDLTIYRLCRIRWRGDDGFPTAESWSLGKKMGNGMVSTMYVVQRETRDGKPLELFTLDGDELRPDRTAGWRWVPATAAPALVVSIAQTTFWCVFTAPGEVIPETTTCKEWEGEWWTTCPT